MNIYLVGFMGTGKSTAGAMLARKKKWHFLDLDQLIEFKEKKAISQIFADSGEAYFRRLEKKALQEASREKDFVIACGGGIVMDPENLVLMKSTGKIVCLSASPAVILERTLGEPHRPLLKVADPAKQVELLLKLRAPFYARADFQVDTSKLTPEKVVEKVIKLASRKSAKRKR